MRYAWHCQIVDDDDVCDEYAYCKPSSSGESFCMKKKSDKCIPDQTGARNRDGHAGDEDDDERGGGGGCVWRCKVNVMKVTWLQFQSFQRNQCLSGSPSVRSVQAPERVPNTYTYICTFYNIEWKMVLRVGVKALQWFQLGIEEDCSQISAGILSSPCQNPSRFQLNIFYNLFFHQSLIERENELMKGVDSFVSKAATGYYGKPICAPLPSWETMHSSTFLPKHQNLCSCFQKCRG